MDIDQLIEKLQAVREEAKHCKLQVCTKLVETDSVWYGEFNVVDVLVKSDAQFPEIKHTVDIVCEGKKTNLRLNQ